MDEEQETFTCWSCDQDESIDEYAGDSRNGHMLCTSCVSSDWTYCENCSVYVLDRYFNGDMNMCGKCCDEYCIECVDCCSLHYRDDMYWSDYDGEPRCGDCHDMSSNRCRGVYEYHSGAPFMMTYRLNDVTSYEPGSHVYYGVELEAEEYPSDMADTLELLQSERVGHAETDGSLNCGVEFITQPSDLASWRGAYGKTIGYTWLKYCLAVASSTETHAVRTFMCHARPLRVNLNNHATVEVRMFAGSNDYDEVLGYVEFVAALAEYTRDITVNHIMAGALLAESFTTWLEDTELNDYSKARELVACRIQR